MQRKLTKHDIDHFSYSAPPPPRLKAEVGDNPSPQSLDDRLPPLLQYPIAAALDLKRELTPEKPAGAAETAAKSPAEKNGKDHTATANKHADPSTPVTAASKSDKVRA